MPLYNEHLVNAKLCKRCFSGYYLNTFLFHEGSFKGKKRRED